MSDNWIALVPEDPRFVPDAAKQQRARERFLEIAPEADEIEIKVSENVVFFDCGGNFERICCHHVAPRSRSNGGKTEWMKITTTASNSSPTPRPAVERRQH
jgi:hypothetical protein